MRRFQTRYPDSADLQSIPVTIKKRFAHSLQRVRDHAPLDPGADGSLAQRRDAPGSRRRGPAQPIQGRQVIAVDTNILARFYCDDPSDPEAKRQRPLARKVMLESASLFVPITVIVELEWVMRGFYELQPTDLSRALEHLLGMPHVTVQHWEAVTQRFIRKAKH